MKADNKKYWMKRKRYGWGWIPATWQGWALLVLQGGIVVITATLLPADPAYPTVNGFIKQVSIWLLAIATIVLVAIGTSPKPHWRWGKKDTDNPDEDF
ncbi:MAG: hypothetical protein ABI602_00145 [Candidatus Saccharibacteria bacterium]